MKCLITIITLWVVLGIAPINNVAAEGEVEVVFNTKYVDICYEDADLFKMFSRNITYGNRLFKKIPIEKRIDMLFVRVRSLLDTPESSKLRIKLHTRTDMFLPTGYYTHHNRTIHINPEDATNKVLAHEMAHAMFDDFLGRRAPGRMGEIIARYIARNI